MVGPADRHIHEGDASTAQPLRPIDPTKPVVLLDVDGVVNALNRKNDHAWPDAKITLARPDFSFREWPIYTSPRLGEALLALDVNIVWLTTWKYDANTAISPLVGLPTDLHVGDYDRRKFSEGFQDWKMNFVYEFIPTFDGPIVWIDDEAVPYYFFEELDSDPDLASRFMIVEPNSYLGLTPDNIDAIDHWLKGVR